MSPDVIDRYIVFAIWGLGGIAVWGVAVVRDVVSWRKRRDKRALSELLSDSALLAVAGASSLAVFVLLWGSPGDAFQAFVRAIALGGFLAAGLIRATIRGAVH